MISKVEAHLIINKKIAHHLECIRELKSEQNMLALISILPPEILAAIFYFVSVGRTESSRFFPCYYFTHVCRSWRSLALATPNLWRVLPRDIRWADIVLERSKGADLVVREDFLIRGFESSRTTFLKRVLANHTSRIRELVLSNVKIPTLAMLVENLPQSSLRLQSFELTSSETVRETQPTFPIVILDTGDLQTLVVCRCIIGHWFSLSFPALTTLKLHHILDRPSLNNFLEFLRGTPLLRDLCMANSPLVNDLVGRVTFVHLPNLWRLSLCSTRDARGVENLLAFIIIPPTAMVWLTATSMTANEAETIGHELASSLFNHFRQAEESPYKRLDLMARRDHLLLYGWKDKIPLNLILDLNTTLPSNFGSNLLQQTIFPFPFLNITSLDLDVLSPPMDTFGRLPHVRKLTVVGECTTELIRALSRKPEIHTTEPVMSFPALKSLWIKCYLFIRGVEDLECGLVARRERKAELSYLALISCSSLQTEDVERLRKVVNAIDWDGVTYSWTPP